MISVFWFVGAIMMAYMATWAAENELYYLIVLYLLCSAVFIYTGFAHLTPLANGMRWV